MVLEFLAARKQINGRAHQLGAWLFANKHYLIKSLTIPSIKSGIMTINESGVSITIGYSEEGPVTVGIPLGIFEAATMEQFKGWVESENLAFKEQSVEAIEARELKLLDSLIMKHPEVATAMLDALDNELEKINEDL